MTEKKKLNEVEKPNSKRVNIIFDQKLKKTVRLISMEIEKATRKYELLTLAFERTEFGNGSAAKRMSEFVDVVVTAYEDVINLQRKLFKDLTTNKSEIIAAGDVVDINISILPLSPWIVASVDVVPGTEKKEEVETVAKA